MSASGNTLIFQSLFEWRDPAQFREALLALQSQRRVSLPTWAKRLGYQSPRSLGMVLNGSRRPSAKLLASLCADAQLSAAETEFISLLYVTTKGRPSPAALRRLEVLRKQHSPAQRRTLSLSEVGQLSHWLTFVIKQLAGAPGFTPTVMWIRSRLKNADSISVKRTLDLLESLGILQGGRLVDSRALFGPIDTPSTFVRRHHRQMLQQASKAIEDEPVDRREILSCTLRVSSRDLPTIKKRMRAFADEFEAEFEKADASDVGQLNLQFFLHTRD